MRAQLGIVRAIVGKDLHILARDRFYAVITVLGLGVYIAVFWLLPATVDETVTLGLHLDDPAAALAGVAGAAVGLEIISFETPADLEEAVRSGDDVAAGLDFPARFVASVAAGERVTVRVLLPGDAPQELRPALAGMVRELAYAVAGEQLPVSPPGLDELVLGADRSSGPLSIRERMRPLLVFFVLMVEMIALASLVAAEIHDRTITALLATPARVSDVLAAKAVFGTLLAFSQAALLMLALGSYGQQAALLLVTVLLGALLVTGMGLIAGSTGGDFVRVVFWSVALLIPLAIPAVTTLLPGTAATWIRAFPTSGLVEVIIGATTYGEGWVDAAPDLLMLVAWCAATLAAGTVLLRRRVARL